MTTIISEESLNSVILIIATTIANQGFKLIETNLWQGISVLIISIILLVGRAYLQKQNINIGSVIK